MSPSEMVQKIEELTTRIAQLESLTQRDRGPKSEKKMVEADAFRVKFGDLKDKKPKDAAVALGLSYGQVFSCRGGYTFKQVKADWKPAVTA